MSAELGQAQYSVSFAEKLASALLALTSITIFSTSRHEEFSRDCVTVATSQRGSKSLPQVATESKRNALTWP